MNEIKHLPKTVAPQTFESHHAVTKRPPTAPAIEPNPAPYSEAPNPEFAIHKSALLAKMRGILAGATGDKAKVLSDMARGVEEVLARQRSPIALRINPDFAPKGPVVGTIEREAVDSITAARNEPVSQGRRRSKKKKKGAKHERAREAEAVRRAQSERPPKARLRAVFKPEERKDPDTGETNPKLHFNLEDLSGFPDGGRVLISPTPGNPAEVSVELLSPPVTNMVGRLTRADDGTLMVEPISKLSAFPRLPLADKDVPKLDAKLREAGDEPLYVICDVQNPTNKKGEGRRVALFHDFPDMNELQLYEADAFFNAGVPGTLNAQEAAHNELIKEMDPLANLPKGVRDLRSLVWYATDNPGSKTDFRSQDPEQIENVEVREDRIVIRRAKAYGENLIGRDTPVARKALRQQETAFGSGWDIPATTHAVAMDKAVFLEGQDRLAAVTEIHISRETGELLLDDCSEYFALVQNRAQKSYRDAQLYYDYKSGNYPAEEEEAYRRGAEALEPEVKQQMDHALQAHRLLEAFNPQRLNFNGGTQYESEDVIKSLSITANTILGELIKKAQLAGVFRVHEEPSESKLASYAQFAGEAGVPWNMDEQGFEDFVNSLPERVAEWRKTQPHITDDDARSFLEALSSQAIRATPRAGYSTDPDSGHYGMGVDVYAHGTAGNRLVSGMANIRNGVAASALLRGEEPPVAPLPKKAMEEVAEGAMDTQGRMRIGEQNLRDIRDALRMRSHVGELVSAKMERPQPWGLTFRTQNPEARIFIPMRQVQAQLGIEDRNDIDVSATAVSLGGYELRFGDVVPLEILEADPGLRRVSARLVHDKWG